MKAMQQGGRGMYVAAAAVVVGGAILARWAYVRLCAADDEPRPGNSWARGSRVIMDHGSAAKGRTFIVTGATSGLGCEAARLLLRAGAHVVFAVRNKAAGEVVAASLLAEASPDATARVMVLDLARLESVRAFADAFISSGAHFDGLLNNAGAFGAAGTTGDGFQVTWQTNYLAPALLTDLLLPAASDDARIVNVSSKLYRLSSAGLARRCPPQSPGDTYVDYGLSKACQIAHAVHLNCRFSGCSRRAFAVEPGLVQTRIMRESAPLVRFLNYALLAPTLKDADQGVATAMLCLLAPLTRLDGPCYFAECASEESTGDCGCVHEASALAEVMKRSLGTRTE
jgi:WW domain-containing oxidoreductase